ncbi:MAG: hypothetical protein K8U57_33240 [Planctomycetes bacterium]|nr:hypothetical protein [Planctomycetota bacterium]
MADKITQQLLDALTKAAAHPGGLPLHANKTEPGLFQATSAAKPAAEKCLADRFVKVVGSEQLKGKTSRDLYGLTDAGWDFLLAQVNPKQVLEDFVRVLEDRRGEVGELLVTARQMADSLQGLKEAVSRVLPVVSASRIPQPSYPNRLAEPNPQTPFPKKEGGFDLSPSPLGGGVGEGSSEPEPVPTAVAVLDEAPAVELAPIILARLADWSEATDCTLPELFRSLSLLDSPPTIGEFHDCLRALAADGMISLPAWTGPLYAMPEPAYAMMNGHGIAYYASLRG